MAVAQSVLSETQRETLEALCDTFVPSVDTDTHDPVEQEFMGAPPRTSRWRRRSRD